MKRTLTFFSAFLLFLFACGTSQLGVAKKDIAAGNYQAAIPVLQAEANRNPQNVDAMLMLAECYEKTGLADSAHAVYQRTYNIEPDNAQARAALTHIYIAKGNAAREDGSLRMALENYESAEKMAPKSFDVHYHRAVAYQKFNLMEKARVALQKAAEISPDDPRLQERENEMASLGEQFEELYKKGVNLYNKNQWDRAIKVLEQAVSLNAGHKDASYTLHLVRGRRFYKKGSVSAIWDAITEFGHASTLRPESAEPVFYMAQSYEKKDQDKNDYSLSIETYQKVVEIEPESALAKKAQKRIKYLLDRKAKMEKFWGKKKK